MVQNWILKLHLMHNKYGNNMSWFHYFTSVFEGFLHIFLSETMLKKIKQLEKYLQSMNIDLTGLKVSKYVLQP